MQKAVEENVVPTCRKRSYHIRLNEIHSTVEIMMLEHRCVMSLHCTMEALRNVAVVLTPLT